MCKFQVSIVCLVLCCVIVNIECYNLDTYDYVKHSGTNASMFGFSVSAHQDRGTSWCVH